MKQLYIIGILVAVLVLVLLGLSKLNNPAPAKESTASVENATLDEQTNTPAETESEQLPPTIPEQQSATTSHTEPMTQTPTENTTVVMKTNKGTITIELYTKDTPITAGNFLKLAQADFYTGVKFHRVIDGFMIQGGDPLTKDDAMKARWGTGGPGYAIKDEFGPGLSNVRGTIAMANSGPNTGGSQFFINTVDNTFLDGKHAVFGRVTAGMDVVDAISKTQTTKPGDVPVSPIVIEGVTVTQ